MAKRILWIGLFFFAACIEAGRVEIRNADFEQAGSGAQSIADWQVRLSPDSRSQALAVLAADSFTGSYAAEVRRQAGSEPLIWEQLEAAPINGGQVYRFSWAYKTEEKNHIVFAADFYDRDGVWVQHVEEHYPAAEQWTVAGGDYNIAEKAVAMKLSFKSEKGTAWYDAITVETAEDFIPVKLTPAAIEAAWQEFQPKTKVLNNFVTQLLAMEATELAGCRKVTFVNPRKGWIYIQSQAQIDGADTVSVSLPAARTSQPVIHHAAGAKTVLETMQYLPPGSYELLIEPTGGSYLTKLIIRLVPEIIFTEYESEKSTRAPWMQDR